MSKSLDCLVTTCERNKDLKCTDNQIVACYKRATQDGIPRTVLGNLPPKRTIPCRLCGQPTEMLGTKLCNRCWELETRITMNPELARKILESLNG